MKDVVDMLKGRTMYIDNNRGLTLIEVLGSMVILSIVILTFISISQYTSLSFGKTDNRTGALRLAENKINEIKENIASATLNINSQNRVTTGPNLDGYYITVYESDLDNNTFTPPAVPVEITNHVSLQAIITLFSGSGTVPRLITVTVSWGG